MSDFWTAEPTPGARWHLQGITQRRLTEAGLVRITEQGQVRIVRRPSDNPARWSTLALPPGGWSEGA
jgi:hypothetical protein